MTLVLYNKSQGYSALLVIYSLIFCDLNKEVSATSVQIFVKNDKSESKILYKLILQVSILVYLLLKKRKGVLK